MARIFVNVDENLHEDLKELARRNDRTVADLIRSAIDDVFEDDLDAIRAERILKPPRVTLTPSYHGKR